MIGEIESDIAVEGPGRIDRTHLTWPERIAIILVLLAVFGGSFLYFLSRSLLLFFCLNTIGVVSGIALAVFSLRALFRLRTKLIAVFSAVWLLLCLPLFDVDGPREWLLALGFYINTHLTGDYLHTCRLTEFTENGVTQTAGFCEGYDRGSYFDYIVYDTSGEFVLPVSQRTPEWKRVMSVATVKAVVSKEDIAYHLYGHFYVVVVSILYLEG